MKRVYSTGLYYPTIVADSQRGQESFLLSTASRAALISTRPPVLWYSGRSVKLTASSIFCPDEKCSELYIGSILCFHGGLLNFLSTRTTLFLFFFSPIFKPAGIAQSI
jgi:hypothetical protein